MIFQDLDLIQRCDKLQHEIYTGIHKYGVTEHDIFGTIYCYEADGRIDKPCNIMDDANIPSLLSIPLITKKYDKVIYQNTRKWIFSTYNPYYFHSMKTGIKGVGSTHTIHKWIWPLALITQGFTQVDDVDIGDELNKYELLKVLITTTAGTGYMHESFNADDPTHFTRKFFGWANSYFSMYANCGQQFLDHDKAKKLIQDKELYKSYLGTLSGIKSVVNQDVYDRNPTFIQWIKECEPTVAGIERHVDANRKLYIEQVFDKMNQESL